MYNPFFIVLIILMVPITPVVMLGMVAITVFAAIYSVIRGTYEELAHIAFHRNTG